MNNKYVKYESNLKDAHKYINDMCVGEIKKRIAKWFGIIVTIIVVMVIIVMLLRYV